MATFGSTVRRGLPRVPGGEPWPPAGTAPVPNGDGGGDRSLSLSKHPRRTALRQAQGPLVRALGPLVPALRTVGSSAGGAVPGSAGQTPVIERARNERDETPRADTLPVTAASTGAIRAIRRGLPRVPGGDPWPPASVAPVQVARTVASAATIPQNRDP